MFNTEHRGARRELISIGNLLYPKELTICYFNWLSNAPLIDGV